MSGSGSVDKWSSELAKLREKGRTIWSSGSSPTSTSDPHPAAGSSLTLLSSRSGRVKRVNSLVTEQKEEKRKAKMSSVVGTCVKELAKLKEKVISKRPLLLLSKAKEEEKEVEKESKVVHNKESCNSMSEATICMLMDRFAPC
ncbi:hypothetical protein JCGZ_10030 [Jatropha curcas]|uniref:Uncharacterized protein n=1 Tax=Jatropha curcas TaxID=180498 RepID=A0A067LMZ3_JATCU|nr:hypothetical protein JCGZ_10030 [Jatropha curcas]